MFEKTNTRGRLQDKLNGCKTYSFKYGSDLNVRQRIIMNVDFTDPQLTQRVSKLSSIFIKKESNEKISKLATDKQLRIYTTIRLKAGYVSWKQ